LFGRDDEALHWTRQQSHTWPNTKCECDFQRQEGGHHDYRQYASDEHEWSAFDAPIEQLVVRQARRDGVGLCFFVRQGAVGQVLFTQFGA
jgi:hypothetical protein